VLLRKVHKDLKGPHLRVLKVISETHHKEHRVDKEPKVLKEDLVQPDQHSKEMEDQLDL
jgi:hypothetical protein